MRILSLNVFPGTPWILFDDALATSPRLQAQLDYIAATDPDVVCLQELFCEQALARYKERFTGQYHFYVGGAGTRGHPTVVSSILATVMGLLFTGLFNKFVGFGVAAALFLRLQDSALVAWFVGGETGLVTMVSHRLTGAAHGWTHDFPEQGRDPLNLVTTRAFTAVHAGPSLIIVNTHLNAYGPKRDRLEQIDTLVNWLDRQLGAVVLCGDLNATEESEELRRLCVRGRLRDTMKGLTPRHTWYSRRTWGCCARGTSSLSMCVDYVLARPVSGQLDKLVVSDANLTVTDTDELPAFSDHHGVLVTIGTPVL